MIEKFRKFLKNSKWGDLNKWGGRKFYQNLINGETLIRLSRMEKNPEINKRACLFIRDLRVDTKNLSVLLTTKMDELLDWDS